MRSAFLLQNGELKKSISAYLIKNVALNFVVCSRVGVLGKKISVIKSTENHPRKKKKKKKKKKRKENRSANLINAHFHELQLQLYLSIYILRVIDYCAFRSQNNSDSLLTSIRDLII